MLPASLAHRDRAVALGDHHHRAARGLELIDKGIHPTRGGRAERAGGIAIGRLGGSGVIDRMIFEIIRQRLALFQPLAQFAVRGIARDDHGAGHRHPGLDRVLRKCRQNILHRLVEIDLDDLAAERLLDRRQILRGVVLEFFEIDAVLGDLAEHLTVGRTGHAKTDRQRRAVTRHPDHAHVMAEILAAELRADAERLRHLQNFLLHLQIAEGVAVGRALGGQRVEIARGRQLHRLHAEFSRGATDHDRQMIGRASRRAERQNLLLQERQQAIFCQHRRRGLEQKALVGGTAALGHEHELVGIIALGVDLALRRHVVGSIFFLIHRDRRHLRIAQVTAQIRVARTFGERGLVVTIGDDAKTLLAHDDRGAGVLAHRQHAAGGDVGVLEEIKRHELVVVAGFLVFEDIGQLLQMARSQIMIDVAERRLRQRPQRLARHHQHVLAEHLLDPHALGRDLLVGRGVGPQRKQRRMLVGRNRFWVGESGGGVHGLARRVLGPEASTGHPGD